MKWTSPDDLLVDLGAALRAKRLLLDLAQEDVAHDASLSVRHYSKIENGSSNATIGTLFRVARILGLDFQELLQLAAGSPKGRPRKPGTSKKAAAP